MWFIGVEVEQETSAPPPKKNPGSAPGIYMTLASRLNLRLLQAVESSMNANLPQVL